MGLTRCMGKDCTANVRTGLVREGAGVDGQLLADGQFCWRCRAKQARKGEAGGEPLKATAKAKADMPASVKPKASAAAASPAPRPAAPAPRPFARAKPAAAARRPRTAPRARVRSSTKMPPGYVRWKQVKSACTPSEYKAFVALGKRIRRENPRSSLSDTIREYLLSECTARGIVIGDPTRRQPAGGGGLTDGADAASTGLAT